MYIHIFISYIYISIFFSIRFLINCQTFVADDVTKEYKYFDDDISVSISTSGSALTGARA